MVIRGRTSLRLPVFGVMWALMPRDHDDDQNRGRMRRGIGSDDPSGQHSAGKQHSGTSIICTESALVDHPVET